MRKLRLLFAWLFMLAAMPVFVACGDDDDDKGGTPTKDTGESNTKDAVVTGGVDNLTYNTATIYGYVNNDDPQAILGMGIIIGTESDAVKLAETGKRYTATSFDPGTDNRRFTVNVEGLTPETTYYYYAFAGQKTANKILSFTTPAVERLAIDLGLPSGTLWANMNVGADSPEEYGDYFAWGETEPKDTYNRWTYKWCNGDYDRLTKYNVDKDYGTVDNKTTLDLADDAAHANWGGQWRMPTLGEVKELLDNTTNEWTTLNGVKGCKFTSKTNGNSIFLPAAGNRWDGDLFLAGSDGNYWSSTLYESYPGRAYGLYFNSGDAGWRSDGRDGGLSVRPVR